VYSLYALLLNDDKHNYAGPQSTQSLPIVARRYAQWCRSLAFIHLFSAPQNGRSYANFCLLWWVWSAVQEIHAAIAKLLALKPSSKQQYWW